MKLTRSELDILAAYPDQLIAMRDTLRTFDQRIDPEQSSKGHYNALQVDFRVFHNSLTAMAKTMQKYIDAGA
jgi:putative lipoic acid-binding regulatory protein